MAMADITTISIAYACLGVAEGAAPEVVLAAFRRAVKAHHPDQGGDPVKFRRVLEAYRLLKTMPQAEPATITRDGRTFRSSFQPPPAPPPQAQPQPPPPPPSDAADTVLRITVGEAFLGGAKLVRMRDGSRSQIKLPPGLRSGDQVRMRDGATLAVLISVEPFAEVRGDDLWLTASVSPDFMAAGGRLEVVTPFGRKRLWVSRSSCARGLFRAPGEGMPASRTHPRGHLYVQMKVDTSPPQSESESMLDRFTQTWVAEPPTP